MNQAMVARYVVPIRMVKFRQKVNQAMEEFEIKRYASLPCELVTFEIDGEKADKDWFGYFDEEDCLDSDCNTYNCCNKYFVCYTENKIKENLPEKFQYLTDHDIEEICDRLESTLAIGDCGWCL